MMGLITVYKTLPSTFMCYEQFYVNFVVNVECMLYSGEYKESGKSEGSSHDIIKKGSQLLAPQSFLYNNICLLDLKHKDKVKGASLHL